MLGGSRAYDAHASRDGLDRGRAVDWMGMCFQAKARC